jgi:hypothetical protein
VVDLVRLELLDRFFDGVAIGQLELDELDALANLVRRRKDCADYVVPLRQQQLSEVGAVLPADPGDEGAPRQNLVRALPGQHCRDGPEEDRDV